MYILYDKVEKHLSVKLQGRTKFLSPRHTLELSEEFFRKLSAPGSHLIQINQNGVEMGFGHLDVGIF